MKIALAVPNFPPEFLGGTERVVLALARALIRLGDEVVVLSGSDRPHSVGVDVVHEDVDGVAVRRVPRLPEEEYGLDLARPRVLEVCARVLRDCESDVLHVHHWSTLSTGIVRRARAMGLGTVVTLHDMWTTCPRFFRRPPPGITCPEGAGREPCVGCAALGLKRPEAWIEANLGTRDAEIRAELDAALRRTVPSRACRERIARHLPFSGELEVVPHGLLEPVKGAPRARDGDPPDRGPLRVGTFGNLVEEKGIALLVYACQKVPDLELHLFGPFLEPPFEQHVKELADRLGVTLSCHGPYDSHGVAHPARELDLAVFPSLCEETYGLVVEEALARGVPVVVSDRGALAERIGGGGLAVAVDELGPLQAAIWDLAADRTRIDRLRAAIPASAASWPTIRDAARRYRELYEETLAETSAQVRPRGRTRTPTDPRSDPRPDPRPDPQPETRPRPRPS